MAHAELIDWDAVTTVVMQQEHEAMMARAAQCRRDNEVIVAFGQWLNEATWGRATGPFVFPPTMTPDEIRDYCMDYMDPELHTWSELLHQIGRRLSAQGHPVEACQNDRERAGWMEAEQDADQDERDGFPCDFFDPEQLADAEQHVRDVADRALRVYQYA